MLVCLHKERFLEAWSGKVCIFVGAALTPKIHPFVSTRKSQKNVQVFYLKNSVLGFALNYMHVTSIISPIKVMQLSTEFGQCFSFLNVAIHIKDDSAETACLL